jgi:hypothetical protein
MIPTTQNKVVTHNRLVHAQIAIIVMQPAGLRTENFRRAHLMPIFGELRMAHQELGQFVTGVESLVATLVYIRVKSSVQKARPARACLGGMDQDICNGNSDEQM